MTKKVNGEQKIIRKMGEGEHFGERLGYLRNPRSLKEGTET